MFAVNSEQERGVGAFFLDTGLVTLLVLATGTGFALGHSLLRSRSSSKKVQGKLPKLEQEDDDRHKPGGKLAKEQLDAEVQKPSQLHEEAIAAPPTDEDLVADDKAVATPTTEADTLSGEKSPCTPTTEEGAPMANAKELARALARESRVAAAAEAAALAAASVFVEALGPDEKSLYAQARSIAREAFSDAAVQTQKGEKVGALVLGGEEVVGYATYVLRPQLSSLNINKLAVPLTRRRHGLGRCLLRHLIQLAKRPAQKSGRGGRQSQPPLEVVCLSALPAAISFYKACGFKEEPGVKLPEEEGEELEEGQVYMEYRLRRRARK